MSSPFTLTISHCEYLISVIGYAEICSFEINKELVETPKSVTLSNRILRQKYPRKPIRTWSNILKTFKRIKKP
ncbi:hypothetical protein HHI36_017854 [Cryptolaemus montrouzieri]|uniref:Uncharacterized protein n=1 Tax=Cryptolaemus montrouzieri TaxID=559131 RepID=A0ABD2NP12_9CUCU